MRKLLIVLLAKTMWLLLRLRYKIEIKGLEKLTSKNLKKPGGVLFLPNHPAALVDPAIATLAVFAQFPIRPLVIEYMYFTPVIHSVMKFLNALPVPNFETSNNSLKRKRNDKVMAEVIKGLNNGENFLLYPAGRLKHTGVEKIGGASATHQIIQGAPQANIVLIRIKGLWGSSFSRALTGKVPPIFPTLKKNMWVLLKNLFFFTPRRKVIIEIEPAPLNFPEKSTRLELNRWLEHWYNQPDGLSVQEGSLPGDSLLLVSYSRWKNELPEIYVTPDTEETVIHLKEIDYELQDKVLTKLSELTEIEKTAIKPSMSLAEDLGLDSLDTSELAMFLQDRFDTGPVPVTELTSVERVMAVAAKKIVFEEKEEETKIDEKWAPKGDKKRLYTNEGETMIEVFLNTCDKMGHSPAYADSRSGILPFSRVKLGTCMLAERIRHMPGKYVGILLPASVGAFLAAFAVQLAGKVPVMINWTIGPRHLEAVKQLSQVEAILTSWAFLERLDTVDMSPIDDKLIMLETVKREFSIFDKIKGLIRSKKSTKSLMKLFGIDHLTKDDEAVLLFTSGSEAMPKGVPLTHDNILSNHRAALQVVDIYSNDVLLAFLPPFHSFGFCITGTLGFLAGIRTAFYPNPTDGKGLAKSFETWGGTITCGAPTFIKAMLKSATPEQLRTMRLCIVGAEKTPPELIELVKKFGKQGCLLEGYGITECSPIISANFPGKPLRGIGKPLPGVEVIITHPETFEPLPQGAEGIFLTRGPNVFHGYLNPDIAPPFVTVDGKEWYNTGDIGYYDEEGYLFISGRKKRFIKAGGEMVSLQAIETALLSAAPAKNWRIREDGPTIGVLGQEFPGAKPFLILVTTFDTSVDEVNQALRDNGFSNLIRISNVVKMEEIPLMGTGKINYRQLEENLFKK